MYTVSGVNRDIAGPRHAQLLSQGSNEIVPCLSF